MLEQLQEREEELKKEWEKQEKQLKKLEERQRGYTRHETLIAS
jgi:hypothetical protein